MRILVYIAGSSPDESETAAAARYEITVGDRLSYRNARFWRGETEANVDLVLTDGPGIRAAYEAVGVKVDPITPRKGRGKGKKSAQASSSSDDPQVKSAMMDEPAE